VPDTEETLRILIYGLNYPPELVGIGKFTGEMARWLRRRGHEVKVICAPPYYPAWRVRGGYSAWRYRAETLDGIDILRCPIWVPKRVTGLTRILHLLSFALSSAVPMLLQRRWRPDLVFAVEPPLFGALPALASARLSGVPAWLHVQDFETDAAFDLGLLRSGWLRKLVFAAERALMTRFSRISTISEKMLERALRKTRGASPCVLFPNWVDTQRIFPLRRSSEYRRRLDIPDDSIVLSYSGSMGEKQGLELVLEAARKLQQDDRYVFVMAGSGSAYARLRDQASDIGNMRWLPLQPEDKLNEFLNLADIHLLPQRADAADLVMPSKLTGMLASGRPMVATARPGTQVAAVVEHAGIVVPPGDHDALTAAIETLGSDAPLRERLGAAARAYATELLDRQRVLAGFEAELTEAMNEASDAYRTSAGAATR
jgi:colanic acid biosynthesis glycosyl transferase WcaI